MTDKTLIETADAKIEELEAAIEHAADMSDLENEVQARDEAAQIHTLLWLLHTGKTPERALREVLHLPEPEPTFSEYTVLTGEAYSVKATGPDEAEMVFFAWFNAEECPNDCGQSAADCGCVNESETMTVCLEAC